MAGGNTQPKEGAAEVGADNKGVGEIGSGCPNFRNVPRVSLAGSNIIWSETWVIYPLIGRTLGGFHHRVSCRLMGSQPQRGIYGRWVYPSGGGDG